VLYWNKIFKVFIPRICWIYGNCLVDTTLKMLTFPFNSSREIWSGNLSRGNFSRYVALIKPRFHRSSGFFFLYVGNFLHPCIYLFSCTFIHLSIYFKMVWPQVCFSLLSSQATCRSRKEMGTVTSQKPNLCLWGTWTFSLRTEKIPRKIIFISIKAFKRYVARFLKRCP